MKELFTMGWPLGQDEAEAQAEPTTETTAVATQQPPVIDVTPRPVPKPGLFNTFGGLIGAVPTWVWTALLAAIVMWWFMRPTAYTNPPKRGRRRRTKER